MASPWLLSGDPLSSLPRGPLLRESLNMVAGCMRASKERLGVWAWQNARRFSLPLGRHLSTFAVFCSLEASCWVQATLQGQGLHKGSQGWALPRGGPGTAGPGVLCPKTHPSFWDPTPQLNKVKGLRIQGDAALGNLGLIVNSGSSIVKEGMNCGQCVGQLAS